MVSGGISCAMHLGVTAIVFNLLAFNVVNCSIRLYLIVRTFMYMLQVQYMYGIMNYTITVLFCFDTKENRKSVYVTGIVFCNGRIIC